MTHQKTILNCQELAVPPGGLYSSASKLLDGNLSGELQRHGE